MSDATKAVFLSYASQDAEAAKKICEALRASGVEVWFDQSELRGGDVWDQKIRKQIKECALFMPVISASTNARAEGYFRLEWKLAVDRSHLIADDAPFFIPVVIDGTADAAARVPDKFREVQWSRLPGGETPPAFAERVRGLLAVTATPGRRTDSESSRVTEHETVPGWRPAAGLTVPGTPWIMEAKLGEGGFGEVWLGRHQAMKEPRVFKFCFRADRVRSLKRELTLFRVLKERIGGHPNIVRLLDVHFDEPPYYVEMDYVEGQSLKVWCDQQGGVDQVPLAVRLEIVAQMADALHAAHAAGVIHRDVKPGNILISQSATPGAQPTAKLSDFGIGQVVSEEVLAGMTKGGFTETIAADSSSSHPGTQLYMAPELLAGAPATIQSDIYSLGVVLFQLVVGDLHCPLTTDWFKAIDDPCLREDLARCFAGRPEGRFASADLFAADLRALPQRRREFAEQQAVAAARQRAARRWKLVLATGVTALLVGLAVSLIWFLQRNAKERWARETALPEINRLIGKEDFSAAFALTCEAEKIIPTDPALTGLWPKISIATTIETTPSGADIYIKEYRKPEAPWQYLRRSPLKNLRLARGFYRWQIKKDGFALLERASAISATHRFSLDAVGNIAPGMVHVSRGSSQQQTFSMTGLQHLPETTLGDFFLDRYEVSNREYKEFVDRGGYSTAGFWKHPLVKQGRELTWAESMREFQDATGRPGPATWRDGSYLEGAADHPVTGVSWFEAAAYAEWAGKRLPSLYHWVRAATPGSAAFFVPFSNFSGRGLAQAGSHPGMSGFGAYDMAGNAKEWCWNEANSDKRYILGGAWNEPDYMFPFPDSRDPFDRSATNGFRCIKLPSTAAVAVEVDAPILPPTRDYTHEQSVSDEVFGVYRSQFSYDKAALDARVDAVDESHADWRKEKVSFNAAYGGERMMAHVFLPKKRQPPLQGVIVFPTNTALSQRASDQPPTDWLPMLGLLIESGRAVIWPIYKGTYERGDGLTNSFPTVTNTFRDHVIQWSKDLGRTIDYLETRPDIQADKLAYFGGSWGAAIGATLPALEPRLKASVLGGAGFYLQRSLPEVDQINFAPRNTTPTLMLNGRYDPIFPVETSQRPMFRLLGAAPKDKRHVLFEAGHAGAGFAPGEFNKEVLDWLDRYLGPVK